MNVAEAASKDDAPASVVVAECVPGEKVAAAARLLLVLASAALAVKGPLVVNNAEAASVEDVPLRAAAAV